jgi:DNA invertase Pin-like site-specific DNA recombinase
MTSNNNFDNVLCTVCDAGDNEETLLLCDGKGCSHAMHTACIGMHSIPFGDWFCKSCEKKGNCAPKIVTAPTRETKVVVYLRVSSKGQDQPEYGRDGLQTQLHSVLDFCMRFGIVILETFSEVGSARNPANLQMQNKMIKKVSGPKNKNTCILVYSVSRFARNKNQGMQMLESLHANNSYVFSVSENVSSHDAKFTDLLTQAQQHSDQLSTVVRDSIERRRKQGQFIGSVPYGFKRDGNAICINELEKDGLKVFVKHMDDTTKQLDADLEAYPPRSGVWTSAKIKSVLAYLRCEPFATLIQSLNVPQGAVSCGL